MFPTVTRTQEATMASTMHLVKPASPAVPLCPRCAMILPATHPASRHDALEMGYCTEHGEVVATYGDPLPDTACPWPIGQAVQVEFPNGWRDGRIDGYRVDLNDDLVRIDVWLGPGEVARGCHPKHVVAAA